jgi:hypothetical protein
MVRVRALPPGRLQVSLRNLRALDPAIAKHSSGKSTIMPWITLSSSGAFLNFIDDNGFSAVLEDPFA